MEMKIGIQKDLQRIFAVKIKKLLKIETWWLKNVLTTFY